MREREEMADDKHVTTTLDEQIETKIARDGTVTVRLISDEQMIRLEAGRHVLQTRKTAEEQSRADKQEHGQRDFRCHEHGTQAMLARAGRRPARTFV